MNTFNENDNTLRVQTESLMPSASPNNTDKRPQFSALILQCPIQGRMTGYSEGSVRRMLDPPLVVELRPVGSLNETQAENLCSSSICYVSILHEVQETSVTLLENLDHSGGDSSKYTLNLSGQSCLSCIHIPIGLQETRKRFIFPFTDLSVRSHGRYRFSCTVINTQTFVGWKVSLTALS